jgi:toxin ParE1/3/4
LNWSPLAISRLSEIAKYIALDNPVAAERWVNKIFALVEKLSAFPERGRVVPEINNKMIREIVSGNYRVIYKLENREISILTVRHVKRLLSIEELSK